jgi:hypothetical protein
MPSGDERYALMRGTDQMSSRANTSQKATSRRALDIFIHFLARLSTAPPVRSAGRRGSHITSGARSRAHPVPRMSTQRADAQVKWRGDPVSSAEARYSLLTLEGELLYTVNHNRSASSRGTSRFGKRAQRAGESVSLVSCAGSKPPSGSVSVEFRRTATRGQSQQSMRTASCWSVVFRRQPPVI